LTTESPENFLEATPRLPEPTKYEGASQKAVKVATPDIILFDEEAIPVDIMTNLIFEQIGGQEIINIARNDIINGQNVIYNLITNTAQLGYDYNPKNIFTVPGTLDKFFKNFSIRLEIKVPESGTGPGGRFLYVDKNNSDETKRGRLIVDVVNMKTNEQVEVQVLDFGSYLPDIIAYTEES
jgi:alpha-L-arabinofuranosidase